MEIVTVVGVLASTLSLGSRRRRVENLIPFHNYSPNTWT